MNVKTPSDLYEAFGLARELSPEHQALLRRTVLRVSKHLNSIVDAEGLTPEEVALVLVSLLGSAVAPTNITNARVNDALTFVMRVSREAYDEARVERARALGRVSIFSGDA